MSGMVRPRSTMQDEGAANRPHDPPEVELWCEVIGRAIDDLCYWFSSNHTDSRMARKAARWLFSPLYDADLLLVCEFAGTEIETVRKHAKVCWAQKVSRENEEIAAIIWKEDVTRC